MKIIRNFILGASLIAGAICGVQAQTTQLAFSPTKTNMTQMEFAGQSVKFSNIEFVGCFFKVKSSTRYRQLLAYDGIDFDTKLEIYSHNLKDIIITFTDVQEKNAILQEYLFRHAVCSMQLTLR